MCKKKACVGKKHVWAKSMCEQKACVNKSVDLSL